MFWYEKEAAVFSPVLSTRVRFARTVEGIPFPARLDLEGRLALRERVRTSYGTLGSFVAFDALSHAEKEMYLATRLASAALVRRGEGTGLILGQGGTASVMIHEEDHLRVQAIVSGKDMDGALAIARSFLTPAEALGLARREGLGYLTACPTNLGAACRISVMIHLPALATLGKIPDLSHRLLRAGFALRGDMGEGSEKKLGLVQISNQQSREATPEEIAESLSRALAFVEEEEREAAKTLLSTSRLDLMDRIGRAVGTLSYAQKMSFEEFSTLYLWVRFGKALGLEEARRVPLCDRHLVEFSAGAMILPDAALADAARRDAARAARIRDLVKES